jgi:hypothetical protein
MLGEPPVVELTPVAPMSPAIAVAATEPPIGVKPTINPSSAGGRGPSRPSARAATDTGSDMLVREANLVSQGRTAMVHKDPAAALRAIRAAKALPVRQLVPEELAVEVMALRALGRDRESVQLEVMLRVSYPDSDLTR